MHIATGLSYLLDADGIWRQIKNYQSGRNLNKSRATKGAKGATFSIFLFPFARFRSTSNTELGGATHTQASYDEARNINCVTCAPEEEDDDEEEGTSFWSILQLQRGHVRERERAGPATGVYYFVASILVLVSPLSLPLEVAPSVVVLSAAR